MGEKADCQYSGDCMGHGDKCLTCVHNNKRGYYEPAIKVEDATVRFPCRCYDIYWIDGVIPNYNYWN